MTGSHEVRGSIPLGSTKTAHWQTDFFDAPPVGSPNEYPGVPAQRLSPTQRRVHKRRALSGSAANSPIYRLEIFEIFLRLAFSSF